VGSAQSDFDRPRASPGQRSSTHEKNRTDSITPRWFDRGWRVCGGSRVEKGGRENERQNLCRYHTIHIPGQSAPTRSLRLHENPPSSGTAAWRLFGKRITSTRESPALIDNHEPCAPLLAFRVPFGILSSHLWFMMLSIVSLALCLPTVLSFTSPALVNQQPEAPNPPLEQRRPLEWGSINFLHTTDVHVLFFYVNYQC
jgi:hypothetical protein